MLGHEWNWQLKETNNNQDKWLKNDLYSEVR